jgi:transcriptional regulator with XRE-family HTH domain
MSGDKEDTLMAEDWKRRLLDARSRLGLSRAGLARRTGLSPETVRAYEQGRRRPTIESLTAVLDALKLDRTEGNRIRLALGFAPDTRDYGTPGVADQYTIPELEIELQRLPWPAFAANEFIEVVAANRAVQKVWDVDLSHEFLEVTERNLLRVASNPRFADRCVNWDEVVGLMVSTWKGHHRGAESLDNPSPYFQRLVEDFLAGDPKYVRRFLDLWQRMPAREPKMRSHYPVVWRDDSVGEMRFLGILGPGNIWESLSWHDWIPVDSESWQRLESLVSGKRLAP